jgi:hypothetical protein
MFEPPRPRDPQRGNSLLLALIVMSALAALGSVTVISVQGGLKASTHDRAQTIAMHAAESGAAFAIEYLHSKTLWTSVPFGPPPFPQNNAQPGDLDNPFSPEMNAWFSVVLRNNRSDPSNNPNDDDDHQVILESTGHGPQNSVAVIEWEVREDAAGTALILLGWRTVL